MLTCGRMPTLTVRRWAQLGGWAGGLLWSIMGPRNKVRSRGADGSTWMWGRQPMPMSAPIPCPRLPNGVFMPTFNMAPPFPPPPPNVVHLPMFLCLLSNVVPCPPFHASTSSFPPRRQVPVTSVGEENVTMADDRCGGCGDGV